MGAAKGCAADMSVSGATLQQVLQQMGCAPTEAAAILHHDGVAADGTAVVAAKSCAAACVAAEGCAAVLIAVGVALRVWRQMACTATCVAAGGLGCSRVPADGLRCNRGSRDAAPRWGGNDYAAVVATKGCPAMVAAGGLRCGGGIQSSTMVQYWQPCTCDASGGASVGLHCRCV